MKTEETNDLTYADIMTGLPEDFKEKFKEVIVILLAQMIEMTKEESEWFIKVWSRLLCIQARVLAREESKSMLTGEKGWSC